MGGHYHVIQRNDSATQGGPSKQLHCNSSCLPPRYDEPKATGPSHRLHTLLFPKRIRLPCRSIVYSTSTPYWRICFPTSKIRCTDALNERLPLERSDPRLVCSHCTVYRITTGHIRQVMSTVIIPESHRRAPCTTLRMCGACGITPLVTSQATNFG